MLGLPGSVVTTLAFRHTGGAPGYTGQVSFVPAHPEVPMTISCRPNAEAPRRSFVIAGWPWRSAAFVALGLLVVVATNARATFSICAVDPGTGEVGSAGASCIAGSLILSDVHPGIGVVHTQAFWNAQNQNYARTLMEQGYSPQEIVDLVVENDAQGNPTIRQYGVVDLVDGGRSAAYTGGNCTDWKGHVTGPVYAIQGNILLGPEIVEDMETAFLGTEGSLAERLMAALQAAKRPRADTRCATKSAISAFLRVGRFNDTADDLFLDLNVNNTSGNTDPIDVLQGLFDAFMTSASLPDGDADAPAGPGSPGGADAPGSPGGPRDPDAPAPTAPHGTGDSADVVSPSGVLRLHAVEPNPARGPLELRFTLAEPRSLRFAVFDASGRVHAEIASGAFAAGVHRLSWDPKGSRGLYFLRLQSGDETLTRKLGLLE